MHGLNTQTKKNKKVQLSRKIKKRSSPKIDVARQRPGDEIPLHWIRQIGITVLQEEEWKGKGSLSIVLIDNERIQELNSRFFNRDRPTDVIAFPLDDEEDNVWGEIYVSEDQAKAQASLYNVTLLEELCRLVIHGILHLVGYDDGDECSRGKMTEREDDYLRRFFSV